MKHREVSCQSTIDGPAREIQGVQKDVESPAETDEPTPFYQTAYFRKQIAIEGGHTWFRAHVGWRWLHPLYGQWVPSDAFGYDLRSRLRRLWLSWRIRVIGRSGPSSGVQCYEHNACRWVRRMSLGDRSVVGCSSLRSMARMRDCGQRWRRHEVDHFRPKSVFPQEM